MIETRVDSHGNVDILSRESILRDTSRIGSRDTQSQSGESNILAALREVQQWNQQHPPHQHPHPHQMAYSRLSQSHDNSRTSSEYPLTNLKTKPQARQKQNPPGHWLRLALTATEHPVIILRSILLVIAPLIWQFATMVIVLTHSSSSSSSSWCCVSLRHPRSIRSCSMRENRTQPPRCSC